MREKMYTTLDSPKKRWRNHIVLLITISLLTCIILGCFLIFLSIRSKLTFKSGPIYLVDARITTELYQGGNYPPSQDKIRPNEPKIYCLVSLSSPKEVDITVEWYRNGKLIYKDHSPTKSWSAFSLKTIDGSNFPEGEYRVDIKLLNTILRSIMFSVSDTN